MAATALVMGGGPRLSFASRKGEACQAVAEEINALGGSGSAEGFAGDVGSEEGVAALAAEVGSRTDRLNILINNAGLLLGGGTGRLPPTRPGPGCSTSTSPGFSHLTRELLGRCSTRRRATRIRHASSISARSMGTQPMADGAYSSHRLQGGGAPSDRTLANELAQHRINDQRLLRPAPFQSKMTAFATATEEQADTVGKRVPLGRIGSPDDIRGGDIVSLAHVPGAMSPVRSCPLMVASRSSTGCDFSRSDNIHGRAF